MVLTHVYLSLVYKRITSISGIFCDTETEYSRIITLLNQNYPPASGDSFVYCILINMLSVLL